MTDLAVAVPEPIVGRSLWDNAWARLKRNRAAMFILYYLAFIAVISVFGPWAVPHEYTTIYGDYVRTPPSLSAYPRPDMIQIALTDAIKRMRVDIKEWHQDGSRVIVTVTSKKPVDDRNIRYLDRSDAFDDTRIESKSPDGLEVTMSSAIKQQYFLFGTDNTGRDLLSRTLMAGRISLA
ncbi:MAG: ABC transporter permease, partial [Mesorhizobium sp.]